MQMFQKYQIGQLNEDLGRAGLCVGQPPALCDDGDPCTFDTCDDGSGCLNLAAPQPTCLVAPRTMLLISDSNKDTKDKLKWKAAKGTGFGVEDLGSPVSNTPYTLCIYDSSVTGASIASRIDVAPGPSWTQLGQKGWRYKDKSAISSGVQKILLRTGVTGKTKLLLTAKGANLPLPPPISASSFFAQNPAVSVQLTNGQGTCWLVHYFDAEKNLVGAFKARAR